MIRLLRRLWRALDAQSPGERLFLAAAAAPVLAALALAGAKPPPDFTLVAQEPATTVILVALDGVRAEEVLYGADPSMGGQAGDIPMPFLLENLVPAGTFIGDPVTGRPMRLGNPAGISMSGYQAMFNGRPSLCFRNECRQTRGETLFSTVRQALPGAVAVFSDWARMCYGLPVFQHADVAVCGRDSAFAHLSRQGMDPDIDTPGDAMMFEAALSQLQHDPPALLYLGLDRTDSVAHSGNYPAHLDVMRLYDGYIARIWAEMERMRAKGHRPVLLITTDHGRGRGSEWHGHAFLVRGTHRAWVLAAGHGIAPRGVLGPTRKRTLFDIRPTVEHLLGVPAVHRFWGNPLVELMAAADS